MKIQTVIISVLLICIYSMSKAQVLEDLSAPAMPAATIIGTQVNEVSKPKTLEAFQAAILNNYIDVKSNVLIPDNYAFEVNPFMLTNRTNFDYLDYLSDTVCQNLWRYLSFSVASTQNYLINDTITSNALGFGGRTTLLNGKVNQQLKSEYISRLQQYKSLKKLQSKLISYISDYVFKHSEVDINALSDFLLLTKELDTLPNAHIIKDILEQIQNEGNEDKVLVQFDSKFKAGLTSSTLNDLRNLIDRVQNERYGWRWDLDAAVALSFPSNNFDDPVSPKQAVWTNITYKPFKKVPSGKSEDVTYKVPRNFEFTGLLRWINNNDEFINKYHPIDTLKFQFGAVFDLGISFELDYKKFSAEIEYIYRMNNNKETVIVDNKEYSRDVNDDTYKLVLNLNYNISKNVVFSYNFGKNYDFANFKGSDLITGFTLNFGFGDVKVSDLIEAAGEKL